MKEYLEQEEDVLSYALFPQVAENFFKLRQAGKYGIDSNLVDYKDKVHPV
jgi:oxaloacetate decarboxylase alpha subunit